MPRNSQGLYTLPAGNPVVPNTLIESNWANPTMDDIALALTGSLPRDGSAPMTGPLTLSADAPTQPRHAISKGYMEQFLAYATGMPIGSVVAYAGASVPSGYFECNGQAVSRTTYADLFATIGTIYGAGDASTTFNVPDMRDEFIRGKSDTRALGSKQAGSFASHTHTTSDPGHKHTLTDPGHIHTASQPQHNHGVNDPGHAHSQTVSATPGSGFAYGSGNLVNASTGVSGTGISIQLGGGEAVTVAAHATGVSLANNTTGIVIGGTGGTETVPQNVAQIYIIKAVNDSTSGGGGTGTLTGVTSSDPNMIAIDNTDPAVPLLDIQANVAEGIPKLDASGKVAVAQLPDVALLSTANTFTALQQFDNGVTEKYAAVAASNIDCSLASVFSRTISGATTLTVSNVAASGNVSSFVLELTNGGTNVTWWAGIKWAGGTAPTLTITGTDVLGFYTHDGGTTWRGTMMSKDSK
jgi:microcystin-dependent protein